MQLAKRRQQCVEHVVGNVLADAEFTGDPDRDSHLLEVFATVRTAGEMPVDCSGGPSRQRAVEVGGDEFHPLLTNDFCAPPPHFHRTSPMSASSAARRRLRALCNNTRWFTSLNSR